MTGESQPYPHDDAVLQHAAADLLADDPAARTYLEFARSAAANEEPFHLSTTQRWAAIGGCLVLFTWGANALIQSSDTPDPIGTVATPNAPQSPSTQPTSPLNRDKGTPLSGKGGAPNFSQFGE